MGLLGGDVVFVRGPHHEPHRLPVDFDAKYKDRPTGPDHYQLSAYLTRFGTPFGGFVTVGDGIAEGGQVGSAATADERRIVEYALAPRDIALSFGRFVG